MIRTLALIARKEGTTRDSFRDHYEEVHAPLALPLLGDLRHYVRNHIREVVVGEEPAFDVLSEFGYGSVEAAMGVAEMLASERGKVILEDEQSFMNKPLNTFFGLELVARQGRAPESGASKKFAILGKGDPGGAVEAEGSALASERWRGLDVGQGLGFEWASFQWREAAPDVDGETLCLCVSEHVTRLDRSE